MFLARPAISSVGVDVLGPSRALLVWEGSRLLFGRGVSDVDGDGGDCWRALGRAAAAAVAADGGATFFTALAVCGLYICAVVLPLASGGRLKEFALHNNGDLREEV